MITHSYRNRVNTRRHYPSTRQKSSLTRRPPPPQAPGFQLPGPAPETPIMLPMARPAISSALCGRISAGPLDFSPANRPNSASPASAMPSSCSTDCRPFNLHCEISNSLGAPVNNWSAVVGIRQGPIGSGSAQPREERGCYAICLVCASRGLTTADSVLLTS